MAEPIGHVRALSIVYIMHAKIRAVATSMCFSEPQDLVVMIHKRACPLAGMVSLRDIEVDPRGFVYYVVFLVIPFKIY